HLESVVGEEDGGLGTLATLERGYRADGAVVMEPTNEAVAPAQAGAFNFRVRVPGLAAHGAVRDEGVSAIENFIPIYRALEDLERRRNEALGDDPLFRSYPLPFPICVGTIRGGDWASSVPDHLTFEGRFGVAPGERVSDARRSLEEAVAEAAEKDPWLRDHPPTVEWWGGRFDPARTPSDHPLVESIMAAAEAVDRRGSEALGGRGPGAPGPDASAPPGPRLRGMTYGADMGLLVNEGGVPTVLYGPGDIRRAHRPDEYVAVDALVRASRTLAVGMMRFCGV
ncbi:MAG: M20/M25/M40 family metallo-hydrolase, partial [Longimicrobiales bacterium]|nr:M20/M25/M40 family metallo-hydrolase [Longimicrobiales bacterium]